MAKATTNLNNGGESTLTGNDGIVIQKVIDTIRGGRTLDVTGFWPTVIKAGHVIIRETTGDLNYKPMPITDLGAIATLGSVTGGSSYTNATYNAVALTGGSGSGATANIVVSGGAVTTVTIVSKGKGYAAGDVLSAAQASIGGTGSGFSVPVATLQAVGYQALPASHEYAGILIGTILTKKPDAGILLRGTVNSAATVMPYPIASILSAVKTALPHILFVTD